MGEYVILKIIFFYSVVDIVATAAVALMYIIGAAKESVESNLIEV